jgi:hypothetical protein
MIALMGERSCLTYLKKKKKKRKIEMGNKERIKTFVESFGKYYQFQGAVNINFE